MLAVVVLRDDALSVERFEAPVTFRAVPKIEALFRDVVLIVERFEALVTFRVVVKRLIAFMTRAFALV
jgi:hypothetical protein